MTTPPKDTTERDELAKALHMAADALRRSAPLPEIVRHIPNAPGLHNQAFQSVAALIPGYFDAYMAEKGRRNE